MNSITAYCWDSLCGYCNNSKCEHFCHKSDKSTEAKPDFHVNFTAMQTPQTEESS